jgi:hypothetical protein
VDRSLLNATVVGACALVWLIALAVGIWRVRHRRDRRGLILAVLALMGLLIVAVVYTGTELGAGVTAAIRERTTGPPATLIASWPGTGELHYRIGSRELVSKGENGRYSVQTGTLRLSSFTAFASAGTTPWEARTMLHEAPPLTLSPGQEQPLQVGPPYSARVEPERQLKRLALTVNDAGGHGTTISDAGSESPPGFEVLDKQGKVAWQGEFAYG